MSPAPYGRVAGPVIQRSLKRAQGVAVPVSSTFPFSPMSLSPAVWLDAADLSTITESSGAVSSWADKSGNGRTVTQATPAAMPTTGANTQNGLNVLTFDGGDSLLSAAFTQTQPVQIFAVGRNTSAAGTNRQLIGNDSTTPTIYVDSSTNRIFAGTVLNSGNATDTVCHSFTATYNGTTSTLRKDRVQIASGNAGTSGYASKRLIIGGPSTFGWVGEVAEVLLFPLVLSNANQDRVETYLHNKWGL